MAQIARACRVTSQPLHLRAEQTEIQRTLRIWYCLVVLELHLGWRVETRALHYLFAAPSQLVMSKDGDLWQDDWEALGIEKRTDYENLWRVFERICGAKRNHFDAKDLAHAFKCVTQSARMCVRVFGVC